MVCQLLFASLQFRKAEFSMFNHPKATVSQNMVKIATHHHNIGNASQFGRRLFDNVRMLQFSWSKKIKEQSKQTLELITTIIMLKEALQYICALWPKTPSPDISLMTSYSASSLTISLISFVNYNNI